MSFNIELTISIIQLALILIILGLLLNNWKPPIKDQYVFIILGLAGIGLGYLLGCGIYWGFIGAGLVFYKGKLVEEFKLVKESLGNLNATKNKKEDKQDNEGNEDLKE